MLRITLVIAFLAGCAHNAATPPDRPIARVDRAILASCATAPSEPATKFRRSLNRLYARLGKPRHRGVDLIAVESDETQTLAGKLAYTAADTDVVGEDVRLYACVDGAWRALGTATTDGDGRFSHVLRGEDRLPAGTRDLFAFVPGDGSGVRFLAYVARPGESVIVTDIDGTLTESENAVLRSVLFGDDIGSREHAPTALAAAKRTVIYVTSRGDQLTELTRTWLHRRGFPTGPLRLAPTTVTRPGARTVAYKAAVLRALKIPIHAGIGNRRSDVLAYRAAGVPADRILIKRREFEHELADVFARRAAIGFDRYEHLPLPE